MSAWWYSATGAGTVGKGEHNKERLEIIFCQEATVQPSCKIKFLHLVCSEPSSRRQNETEGEVEGAKEGW